jgi:hypothetical protein
MGILMSLSSLLRFAPRRVDPFVQRIRRLGVLGVLCVVLGTMLGGCGWINPAPPRSVVAEAVAQKVAQTQVALQQQLGQSTEVRDWPQPSGIHMTEHHWMTLQNQPTLAVGGTYHLKGGGLGWGQQRQTHPFRLYLRRSGEDQWQVVDPANSSVLPER